jgi:putative transposase
MSRPLRIVGAGLVYHVVSRGNNKMDIFLDALDSARFLQILAEVVERFDVEVWLFCLMSNHFHLVTRTRQPNLSHAMKHLNGEYARWWNKRHRRVGHLVQGRFKAQIVETSVYLVRLCRYVLLNPVRRGLCAHPGDWPWSSYAMLAGTTPPGCVNVGALLARVDAEHGEAARGRLLDYVEPEADPDIAAFIRSDRRIIGTDAFAAQFRAAARAAAKEVPLREHRIGLPGLIDILADAVRRGDGLPGGVTRAHAAHYPVTEIARCAGLSRNTVQRILDGRPRRRRRPGTGRTTNADLTPEGQQTQT